MQTIQKTTDSRFKYQDGSGIVPIFRYPSVKEKRAIETAFESDDLDTIAKGVNMILTGWEGTTVMYTGDIREVFSDVGLLFMRHHLLDELELDELTKKKSWFASRIEAALSNVIAKSDDAPANPSPSSSNAPTVLAAGVNSATTAE